MAAINRRVVTRLLGGRSKKLVPAFAAEVLTWRFSDAERQRVSELLDKKNCNESSRIETDDLDTFVVLGEILDILHAKARLTVFPCAVICKIRA